MPRTPTLLTIALLGGCKNEASMLADRAPSDYSTGGSFTDPGGGSTPGGEAEDDFLALPPAQTEAYVFIANPARNTVSRVTVETLAVITTEVRADPRIAMTTPDGRTAVVFNRGDDSVSLLDAESLDQRVVPVRDDLNVMKLSPDGAWAVLWHDAAAEQPGDPPPDGLQSFSEASFVEIATGTHSAMAVGFDPKDVVFTPDGTLAAVVSDGYLTLIPLDATPLAPRQITLTDALEPPVAEEVVLAPDGSYAFVRQLGGSEILVVDLAEGIVDAVPVGATPTDLDLSPDGRTAAVVTRGSEELWTLDVADPHAAAQVLPLPAGMSFGSIRFAPDGLTAVLYTTASPVDAYAVWDLVNDGITTHGLVKPVASVAIAPDSRGMLVFHTDTDATDADPGSPFLGEWALTMVDLEDLHTNPLLLPAPAIAYAMSASGRLAWFAMDGEDYLEQLDFATLLHTQIPLKSPPVFVGAMRDADPGDADEPVAWVSQDYDLGRISFWEPDSGDLETITGFELNSGIE